ncbi:unnamed protein product, partial [marine sediment metagenome]
MIVIFCDKIDDFITFLEKRTMNEIFYEFKEITSDSIIKLTEDIDYTLDHLNFLVFYYEDYFNKGPIFNFTMYLIWEYHIALDEWTIKQAEETPLIMNEREQEFTSRFTYYFFIVGYYRPQDLSASIPIHFIDIALTIKPPDKDFLSYQAININ